MTATELVVKRQTSRTNHPTECTTFIQKFAAMYRPLARSVLEKSLPILMPRKRRSQNAPEHSGYQQLSARSYPMKRRLLREPCGLSKTTRHTPNSKPTHIQALNISTDLGGLTGEKPAWLAPTHATPYHSQAQHTLPITILDADLTRLSCSN